jgi:glutathione synthase
MLPGAFPRSSFEYVQDLQPVINELTDKISRDRPFLRRHLEKVSAADPFTKRLLDMYEKVDEDVIKDGVQIGILRSDYMLNDAAATGGSGFFGGSHDGNLNIPLQIEVNTIASSFGCLSKKVSELHRYMMRRNSDDATFKKLIDVSDLNGKIEKNDLKSAADLVPENLSIEKLAFTLSFAHFLLANKNAVVLFVVQPGERNVADQRALEAQLWDEHNVKVEFMTLREIEERARVGNDKKELFVRVGEEEREVSVVYYRAGYSPDDYPTEHEWVARELMEKSAAMKCPNVGYHLAGTKKIQQVLCEPGVLESLGVEQPQLGLLRGCFAKQYSLGSAATAGAEEAVQKALADGSKWVLKPQREGGGNNFYGAELVSFLRDNAGKDVLSGYVLMQRIFPTPGSTVFFRNGGLEVLPSISELGIYGTYLGDGQAAMINDCSGYLLRSKPSGVDEGGVATGYSVINSVLLCDDN